MVNHLHHYYLQQMGIEPWILRHKPLQSPIKLLVAAPTVPLEGKAATLLQNMLKSIGLLPTEWSIFSENSLLNQPVLILGVQFAQALLNTTKPLVDLRGIPHTHQGRMFFVTYHPSDLLQAPEDKKRAYQDLLQIGHLLNDK